MQNPLRISVPFSIVAVFTTFVQFSDSFPWPNFNSVLKTALLVRVHRFLLYNSSHY